MKYVSLADQGFHIPYQQLGQSLARYADRRDAKKQRKEDIDWRNTRRGDELAQQGKENARMDVSNDLNKLALSRGQREDKQRDALTGMNISSFGKPSQGVPPGFQGPPSPAITLDLKTPFHAQPPEVQQNLLQYAQQNQLPIAQAIQQFQAQQAAMTGQTPMPAAPPGMVPSEAEIGSFKFKAAPSGTPPHTVTDKEGREWSQDPSTGKWDLLPASRKNESKELLQGELQKLTAMEQAGHDLDAVEQQLKNFGTMTRGPALGRLTGTWNPWGNDAAALEQAVNGAVPNLARGVFGEVGVLTDADREVYKRLIPTSLDNEAIRNRKLAALREKLDVQRQLSIGNLAKAGRDVSKFTAPIEASAAAAQQAIGQGIPNVFSGQNAPRSMQISAPGPNLPRFNSEAEARAAGLKPAAPGQPVAIVFDPITRRDRPWAP